MSYLVDATGLINVTIDRSKIPADIMASADAAALKFVTELQSNQITYEKSVAAQNYRPTPSEFDGLQDDYLLQEDMEAELRWWRYLDWTLKTAGVAGLAAGATALTNQLQQLNAIGHARVVLVSLWREIENFARRLSRAKRRDLVDSGTYRRNPSSFHSLG